MYPYFCEACQEWLAVRAGTLRRLGYKDYDNYRSRALWKRIRERILERDDRTCRRCKGEATVVHHRSYSEVVLKGEDDEQLVSLCEGCHEVVEFDDSGVRRSDTEKESILAQPCGRYDYPAIKVDLRLKSTAYPALWPRMNWWQRRGWFAAYQYVRVGRKWPNQVDILARYRATADAINNRGPTTRWQDVP